MAVNRIVAILLIALFTYIAIIITTIVCEKRNWNTTIAAGLIPFVVTLILFFLGFYSWIQDVEFYIAMAVAVTLAILTKNNLFSLRPQSVQNRHHRQTTKRKNDQ